MEWTSVNDELPIVEGIYVVWSDDNDWHTAYFYENQWCYLCDKHNIEQVNVTHWLDMESPNGTKT